MISVWGKFYTGTDNFQAMQDRGFLYQLNLQDHLKDWIGFPYTFYDAFNPEARDLFWNQLDRRLFQAGRGCVVDGRERADLTPSPPTIEWQHKYMNPTAKGTAARMLNAWSLENSRAIYEGQRQSAPNQRVYTLTRFRVRRPAALWRCTWSGDVTSTWTA